MDQSQRGENWTNSSVLWPTSSTPPSVSLSISSLSVPKLITVDSSCASRICVSFMKLRVSPSVNGADKQNTHRDSIKRVARSNSDLTRSHLVINDWRGKEQDKGFTHPWWVSSAVILSVKHPVAPCYRRLSSHQIALHKFVLLRHQWWRHRTILTLTLLALTAIFC